MLYCPYRLKVEQVTQTAREYDEIKEIVTNYKLIERQEMMECPKEECAAWQDGKCKYKQ